MGSSTGGRVPRIMVFRPTMEEMKDFAGYISKMEFQGAHKAGLAKVIPPKEWIPRKAGYDNIDLNIPFPIEQVVHGRQGLFTQFNMQKKAMKVKDFEKLAETPRYKTPKHFDYEDLERKYWKNISFNPPIYGADVSGSLYDPEVKEFNINHLNTILDLVGNDYGIKIEGVNTAYLYFGMWKTTFAWHTEDMDLYSINYLHFGAPKSWYAIPPEHGRRLERLAAGFFTDSLSTCPAFLRHKMTIISPQILKQYSIPFNKITQEPGEFMITFPFGYHAGFNHGFNCAESTNFASERWVEYGKRAQQCTCRKDGVKIGMDVFVSKFQPDRYELWKEGKDVGVHPEDPSRCTAAPPPSKAELLFYKMEGERQMKSDPECSVSKRHPIAKVAENDESTQSSSSSSSSSSSDSSDTEVYDVNPQESMMEAQKKVKSKRRSRDNETSSLIKKIKKNPASHLTLEVDEKKKKRFRKKSNPPILKPFFAGDSQGAPSGDSYSALVSEEGPLKVIISKQSHLGHPNLQYMLKKPNPNSGSLIPASLLPLQHAAMAKCEQAEKKVKIECQEVTPSVGGTNKLLIVNKPELREGVHVLQGTQKKKEGIALMYYPIPGASSSSQPVYQPVFLPQLAPFQTHHLFTANLPQSSPSGEVISQSAAVQAVATLSHGHIDDQTAPILGPPQNILVNNVLCTNNRFKAPSFVVKTETDQQPYYSPVNLKSCWTKSMAGMEKANLESNQMTFTDISSNSHLVQNVPETHSLGSLIGKEELKEKAENYDSDDTITSTSSIEEQEDSESNNQVQEDVKSNLTWMQSISGLWHHVPANFDKEKQYNYSQSLLESHCAICNVFRSFSAGYHKSSKIIPPKSKVLMPDSVFAENSLKSTDFVDNLKNSDMLENHPLLGMDGSSPLLQCVECKVCVHAVCYGVNNDYLAETWHCDRCLRKAVLAKCCLCPLLGGALKPVKNSNQWAHIICAALVPEVVFTNVSTKDSVDLTLVPQKRAKLTCIFCKQLGILPFVEKGICIQCSSGKCNISFHVTCGHIAGVIYAAPDWPHALLCTCTRHTAASREKVLSRNLSEVKVGDKVLAKYYNGRYYHCLVISMSSRTHVSADFDDGSFSENLFPGDIVQRYGKKSDEPLTSGEIVLVKWTDGEYYKAVYKGERTEMTYTVEFEDGSEKLLKREEFFRLDEELPKKVLSRLSFATERQYSDIFQGGLVMSPKKAAK